MDHPSQDNTDRFAIDALLRKFGFTIFSRPKKGNPKWERLGVVMNQRQALRCLPKGQVRDAKFLEDIYHDVLFDTD